MIKKSRVSYEAGLYPEVILYALAPIDRERKSKSKRKEHNQTMCSHSPYTRNCNLSQMGSHFTYARMSVCL